jgi:SAM-dependent methyltransferase
VTERPHSSWAEVYDLAYERSFGRLYADLSAETIGVIKDRVPSPAKVVDFGAGTGRLSIPLSESGYDVLAVDPCEEMLRQLRKKDPESKIVLWKSRMQDFAGADDCDLALCVFTVLLYLPDAHSLEASLEAAFRSLRAGGHLLIDIPQRGIFSSYERSDEEIDRRVTVKELDKDVFSYREELTVRKSEGESSYVDEFRIRYWPVDEVMMAMEKAGFLMAEDCSDLLCGSGSRYYLMEKPQEAGRKLRAGDYLLQESVPPIHVGHL